MPLSDTELLQKYGATRISAGDCFGFPKYEILFEFNSGGFINLVESLRAFEEDRFPEPEVFCDVEKADDKTIRKYTLKHK